VVGGLAVAVGPGLGRDEGGRVVADAEVADAEVAVAGAEVVGGALVGGNAVLGRGLVLDAWGGVAVDG
jgi:hypothetical protein